MASGTDPAISFRNILIVGLSDNYSLHVEYYLIKPTLEPASKVINTTASRARSDLKFQVGISPLKSVFKCDAPLFDNEKVQKITRYLSREMGLPYRDLKL